MRVVVASADPDLSASIAFSLTQAGYDVDVTQSAADLSTRSAQQLTDLLMLDMNLDSPGAIELCRAIRRSSTAPIMILAARDSEDDLVAAVEAGADEYIRKPFSPRTLIARVRALARRAPPRREKTIVIGSLQLDIERQRLRIGATSEVYLSPLEAKALHILLKAPGRTVTTEKLLLQLWGEQQERERHTLKQLIYRLRLKLDAAGAEGIVRTTPGSGYKLVIE